ncbi:MAG: CBS domain-containing protein [Leptolinea sp.]
MQLILTHDQADFDGLASLLGAALINEGVIPVLPPRLNRNVHSFLNLYGAELPFVEQQDLSGEIVDSIILVDTQSLVTVKGMHPNTPVHVIDHHNQKPNASPSWKFSLDKVGACTTLFAEHLRDQNSSINQTQATLLLLGIYEDTGSLSYASTTARDVRAAAYLLDQGASLKIAAEFLNPPLSPTQRQLYDRLLLSAKTLHIHGHTVIIASSHVEDMNEEISSIAHKLRDLLDPDALIVLVTMRDGVRLIARSTSDRIDVARLAREFGGGGHERASAALLHPDGETTPEALKLLLVDTCTRLEGILPTMVQPSIRVRKIMSRRPLLITPTTSTQQALSLMQKYGYEGYPVVDDGKVVGLLTRRAVDRAISHNLNLPISSLMETGEVTVSPDDPIEQLQDVMTKTGWGQIPVVDPEKKKVIGIVTRTDLLKTLRFGEASLPGHINLTSKLEASLPPARLALIRAITKTAEERHLPLYIVGGFVRDLLLDRPGEDFDIVVEGDAIGLARSLSSKFGGRVVSHSRFGTAKWQIGEITADLVIQIADSFPLMSNELPDTLDFISARTEFYEYPTALPTVERSSIKLDLHRRDFTINTMAMRLDDPHHGELYDFWGGMTDLKQKQVRALHSLSFVDDPTRMLRATRFEQRFRFHIEARTLQLITEAKDMLRQVSGDRIRHEFNLIFLEENPPAVFGRLQELGLLEPIFPHLHWGRDQLADWITLVNSPAEKAAGNLHQVKLENCWLAFLIRLHSAALESACLRFKLPCEIVKEITCASRLQSQIDSLPHLSISEVVKLLDSLPTSSMQSVAALNSDSPGAKIIGNYLDTWKKIHPSINGRYLEKMGLARGPNYRLILDSLRAAWLNGEIKSREEEELFLHKIITRLELSKAR